VPYVGKNKVSNIALEFPTGHRSTGLNPDTKEKKAPEGRELYPEGAIGIVNGFNADYIKDI